MPGRGKGALSSPTESNKKAQPPPKPEGVFISVYSVFYFLWWSKKGLEKYQNTTEEEGSLDLERLGSK